MRETSKRVKVQGREFEIRAFDALTGSYIAYTILQKALPGGMEKQVQGLPNMPESRSIMSKAEFMALQKDILSVVYEVLPARSAPLLNENGSWGVPDIGQNTLLVMILTVQALAFNIGGFFGEGGLQELRTALKDLLPANTPM